MTPLRPSPFEDVRMSAIRVARSRWRLSSSWPFLRAFDPWSAWHFLMDPYR